MAAVGTGVGGRGSGVGGVSERPVQPQAIASDGADEFDVHARGAGFQPAVTTTGRLDACPTVRLLRRRWRRSVFRGAELRNHVQHAAEVGHPRAEAIDELAAACTRCPSSSRGRRPLPRSACG